MIVFVREFLAGIKTANPSASSLVLRLVDAGVLREFTGYARNRRFRYDSYIRLFSDEPPSVGP